MSGALYRICDDWPSLVCPLLNFTSCFMVLSWMASVTISGLALLTSSPHVLMTLNMLCTNVVVISWVLSDFMNNSMYKTASLTVDCLSLVVAPVEVDGVTVDVVAIATAAVLIVVVVDVDWLPELVCFVLTIVKFQL